ncbi:3-phosphoshikimate 1-carboxyvinyltransferase [Streptomyces sp. NPDC095613]|uniref:3-phosphoshikimate 1-carboxyvinyltransferase n=1 Tax=Streptomyces sp. NPDC095613 TaxID=3155540 RepID=UPI00331F9E5C
MTDAPPPSASRTARIPGSKSLTNRALLLSAATPGTSRVWAPLVSADTLAFRQALTTLGIDVAPAPGDQFWDITATGRGPVGPARVWCADAGTAARFLPAFAATGTGRFLFDGSEQLRARPLRPLLRALTQLGARMVEHEAEADLPVTVDARGLDGGSITLDSSMSSQFLSGLLMVGPLMHRPFRVVARDLVSRPYIDMTVKLMRQFGAEVTEDADGTLTVQPGSYTATNLVVEPDASTATYVFAAAAITGSSITVPGLGFNSLQGDLHFTDALRRLGAQVDITAGSATVTGTGGLRGGIEIDMGDISDTFMTLAAIAPCADGPVTIRGIRHARYKESDRITAVAQNLTACGIKVEEGPDRITVHPGRPRAARIACHRDHRIAMAFSVLGLTSPGALTLDDPGCVSKTFPGFHSEFRRLFPQHRTPFGDLAPAHR